MAQPAAYATIRIVAALIVLLMLAAIGYAGWISIVHWDGIGV
jgi:hypothetical protein